jgi:hypothetical protein
LGLGFFPDSTNMGLWEFAANLQGSQPYQQIVPVGPLSASLGVISRRSELRNINAGLQAMSGQGAALYGSVLAAYTYMTQTYDPHYVNALIVLTAGIENARGDITAQALIKKLQKLYNPTRQIGIIFVVFGNPSDFSALKQFAGVTNGQAYKITNPSEVGRVFFAATARRLCNRGCVKA